MKRKAIAMAMAMMMIASAASVCSAASVTDFKDVPSTSWYYASVKGAVDDGYMNGVTKDTFAPSNNLTRAMFATILARYDKATVDNTAKSAFTDVLSDQWYTGSVVWGSKNGIINGYSATKFGTNDFIKREDLALMVYRYVNFKKYTLKEKTPVTFKDADQISAYAKEALEYCRVHGLFIGDQNGYLHPQKLVTRAEAAAVMERIDLVIKESTGGGSSSGGNSGSNYDRQDYTVVANVSKTDFRGGTPLMIKSYDKADDNKYHAVYNGSTLVTGSDDLSLLHVAKGFTDEANIEDTLRVLGFLDGNGQFIGKSVSSQEIVSADGTINDVVIKYVPLADVVPDNFADTVLEAIVDYKKSDDTPFNISDVKDFITILDSEEFISNNDLDSDQKVMVEAVYDKLKEYDGDNNKLVDKILEKYPELNNVVTQTGIDLHSAVAKYMERLKALAGVSSTAALSDTAVDPNEPITVEEGIAVKANPFTVAKKQYEKGINAFIDKLPANSYISQDTLRKSSGIEKLYEAMNPESWAPNGKLMVENGQVKYSEYTGLSQNVVNALEQTRIDLFEGKTVEEVEPQIKGILDGISNRWNIEYSVDTATLAKELAPILVKETPTLDDVTENLKDVTVTVTVSDRTIIRYMERISGYDYAAGESTILDNMINKAQGKYKFEIKIAKEKCEE